MNASATTTRSTAPTLQSFGIRTIFGKRRRPETRRACATPCGAAVTPSRSAEVASLRTDAVASLWTAAFAPLWTAAFAAILLLQPVPASAGPSGEQTMRVLMVGNSLSKGIRRPLEDLAESRGINLKVSTLTKNGATLGSLIPVPKTARKIASQVWDLVILQEQSTGMLPDRFADSRTLDAMISAAGSRTMFLMTWRDRGQPTLTYDSLRGEPGGLIGYVPIAYELDAPLAPVGWAFRAATIDNVYPELWGRDGHHASRAGQYLAAAVLYTMIFEESPVGLWIPKELGLDQGLYYQQLAADAVFGEMDVWSDRSR